KCEAPEEIHRLSGLFLSWCGSHPPASTCLEFRAPLLAATDSCAKAGFAAACAVPQLESPVSIRFRMAPPSAAGVWSAKTMVLLPRPWFFVCQDHGSTCRPQETETAAKGKRAVVETRRSAAGAARARRQQACSNTTVERRVR